MGRLRAQQNQLRLVDYLKTLHAYRLAIGAEKEGMPAFVRVEGVAAVVGLETKKGLLEITFLNDNIVNIKQKGVPEEEVWKHGRDLIQRILRKKEKNKTPVSSV